MHKKEVINTVTHVAGAVFALAGLVVLVVSASLKGDAWRIVSFTIYGLTLLLLYSSSALYHGAHGRVKKFLRMVDHQAIYLLIAGTYTPFTLVTLRGVWGWSLFAVIWTLAGFGIVVDSFHKKGHRLGQLVIYLMMSWMILLALGPLARALPFWGLAWLMIGGLSYMTGVIFYLWDDVYPHYHGIWHLFVLGGSLSHYFAILLYI